MKARGGMIGQPLQNVSQPSALVNVIEVGGLNQM
jgi:hypothetical protein